MCCLGVKWESWSLWDSWWPLLELHSHLLLILLCSATCCCSVCSVVLTETPSASLVLPSLFHGLGFSIHVRRCSHGAGEHSPAAPWAEEKKGGLTWAHSVLWGVLLGAGSAEKCVLWKPWVCTVLWLCLVGCACPFLRACGCHCALLGAVS